MEARRAPADRVNHACERCRSRKEKCDGQKPTCSSCAKQGAGCAYEELKRRGKARRPGRMKALEDRLEAMESLLVRSSLLDDKGQLEVGHGVELASANGTETAEGESGASRLGGIVINSATRNNTMPSELSSHLAFMRDLQGTKFALDDTHQQASPSSAQQQQPLPPRRVFVALPPKAHMMNLMAHFLDHINNLTPLFGRQAIEKLCRGDHVFPPADAADWAIVNGVLALAARHRAVGDVSQRMAWGLFRNAFGVLDEIIAGGGFLELQAVVVMALFVKGSGGSRILGMLVSTAARMMMVQGLDVEGRSGSRVVNDADGDEETRRRVFWIVYCLDVESSICAGLPMNLRMDPAGGEGPVVGLPSEKPADGLGELDVGGGETVNVFRLTVQLAIIQAKAYRLVRCPTTQREDVLRLLAELDRWREGQPEVMRPKAFAHEIEGTVAFEVARLHLAHYRALIYIYQAYVSWARRAGKEVTECSVEATRVALVLLGHVQVSSMVETWELLPTVLAAVIILVDYTLRNASGSEVQRDVQLLRSLIGSLAALNEQKHNDLERFAAGCAWFLLKAEAAIAAAASGQDNEATGSRTGLCDPTEWFAVAEGLLGNLPGPRAVARAAVSELVQSLDRPDGILTPDSLLPRTYKMEIGHNAATAAPQQV